MVKESERAVRIAARYMDNALEEYAALSSFYLQKGRPEEVCYQSADLLHELGEDESQSEDEFDGNGDAMKGLITGLRTLVLDEERLPKSKRSIRTHYKEIMNNIQDVRQMLQSVYRAEE